jgi:hypothetical protein
VKQALMYFFNSNNSAAFFVFFNEEKSMTTTMTMTMIGDIKTHDACSKKKVLSGAQDINEEEKIFIKR